MIMDRINKWIIRIKAICKLINSIHDGDELNKLTNDLSKLERKVGDKTTVNFDIHGLNDDMIIAIGRYKNHDYVRIFDVTNNSFTKLVDELKYIEKNSKIGRVDHWPSSGFLRSEIDRLTKDGRF